jgi:hypothetical protein
MKTVKFETNLNPTKRTPIDDASQAHLMALAIGVVRDVRERAAARATVAVKVYAMPTRDPVETEVDAMFDTETHARMTAAYRGEL